MSAISAFTTSFTKPKQRDCEPSPNTVIGFPVIACCTSEGITMP